MRTVEPMKFGILCNGTKFSAWEAECLRILIDSEVAKPALLIVDGNDNTQKKTILKKLRGLLPSGSGLWQAFNRYYLDRVSKSTVLENLGTLLEDVPRIICRTEKPKKFAEVFHEADIETIKEHKLDFILRFGFGIIKGEILNSAEFGVWSYHHGDPEFFRGQPPGFWEISDGTPVTGVILQKVSEKLDAGTILHKGYFKTELHSYAKTRDRLYFGAAAWVKRVCSQIKIDGSLVEQKAIQKKSGPIYRIPNNVQFLRFLFLTIVRFVRVQWRSLFVQQWSVGMIKQPIERVAALTDNPTDVRPLWCEEPKGAFYADPFAAPLGADGKPTKIFVERYDWNRMIGEIGSIDFHAGKGFSAYETIFDPGFHMSYPSVFTEGRRSFCVPESIESGATHIAVVADDLPEELSSAIRLPIQAVDPTIVKHGGSYWLFCSMENHVPNTDLHIFYAPRLEGPWKSHPLNPVKTDVRSARPGGTPFLFEGRLYRPAQDCSRQYGGRLAINRIDRLDEETYAESTIHFREPEPRGRYPSGFHTLSSAGPFTLIDGSRQAFVPAYFFKNLIQKMRKMFR